MIKFHCPNCKHRLDIPDEYAGRRVHCNQCNQYFVVPEPQIDPAHKSSDKLLSAEELFRTSGTNNELKLGPGQEPSSPGPGLKTSLLENIYDSDPAEKKPLLINEVVRNPKWFWPFLFPFSTTGLGIMVLFILCKCLLSLLIHSRIDSYLFMSIFPFVYILTIFFIDYLCQYLSACVQLTAQGKILPPNTLFESINDFSESLLSMARMFLAITICVGPAILYFLLYAAFSGLENIGNIVTDVRFWALLIFGQFFLPMMLLSVIMNDSAAGVNPFLIIRSIRRTLRNYLVLVLFFSILIELLMITVLTSIWTGTVFDLCAFAILFYFFIVAAAILGRFFYRNEKQLDWDV